MTGIDALDQKANDAFAGRVVRKDLVRQVKVGANVPVYVLEFLLGKYRSEEHHCHREIELYVPDPVGHLGRTYFRTVPVLIILCVVVGVARK